MNKNIKLQGKFKKGGPLNLTNSNAQPHNQRNKWTTTVILINVSH